MSLAVRRPQYWPLWLAGALVLLLGMRLDVMEVDSAQYASIAREMLAHGEWLEVYEHGRTYNSKGFPDKPPLLFWTGAAGMWLLGENNWGFKLIATLIGIFAIFAVGRWAELLYGQAAKVPARVFYSFNAGFLLMHMDLRTDAMLVHFITISCWQLELYFRTFRKRAFVGTITAIALGMMAKGPVALIAVIAAFVPDALLRREWNRLFRLEWLYAMAGILLLLSPMLYGLYQQWGWEKGIKYFFWTQSFGRITGENVWQNDLPATYLLENFSWSFLPWVPLFIGMLFSSIRSRFSYLNLTGMLVPVFGFALMLVAMSISKYKLPHYVYVCWPFAAVWLAAWWSKQTKIETWKATNRVIGFLIVLFTSFLMHWVLALGIWSALPLICWLLLMLLRLQHKTVSWQGLWPAIGAFVIFGFVANALLYPKILSYQSASEAGKIAKRNSENLSLFYHLESDESAHALHFYSGQVVAPINPNQLPPVGKLMVYTTPILAQEWKKNKQIRKIETIELSFYKVSSMTSKFLHSQTRDSQLEKRVLLTVTID